MIGKLFPRKPLRAPLCVALASVGGQVAAAQINFGLYPSAGRNPNRLESNRAAAAVNPDLLLTDARARLLNAGTYAQYGFELRTSVQIIRRLALDAGLARVMSAFFRGTSPRRYVDSAPHTVANAALTLTDWRGTNASLRFRHTGNYRLDGGDAALRASGLDVLDLGLSRRLRPHLDLNLSLDNLLGKRYFETQNFFESRLRPGDAAVSRIHARPPARRHRRRHAPTFREVN